MTRLYRMTALVYYSNGSLPWPEGMSANWPEGETRVVDASLYERLMRDGTGKFDVKFERAPEPPAPVIETPVPEPELAVEPEPAAPVEAPPKKKGGRPRKPAPSPNKE